MCETLFPSGVRRQKGRFDQHVLPVQRVVHVLNFELFLSFELCMRFRVACGRLGSHGSAHAFFDFSKKIGTSFYVIMITFLPFSLFPEEGPKIVNTIKRVRVSFVFPFLFSRGGPLLEYLFRSILPFPRRAIICIIDPIFAIVPSPLPDV